MQEPAGICGTAGRWYRAHCLDQRDGKCVLMPCDHCRVAGREASLCLIGGRLPLVIVADCHALRPHPWVLLVFSVTNEFAGLAACFFPSHSALLELAVQFALARLPLADVKADLFWQAANTGTAF